MGISKKALKRKHKQDKRVSPKAKEKAKKGRQIQDREKHKASKRKAAELTSGGSKEDKLDRIKSVDELLQSDIFADDPEEDGDDESSAGGFVDVDDDAGDEDGDDAGVPDFGGLGEGARHEKELESLKKSDPEFYKFLIENDKNLLDFRAPEGEDEDEEDEEPEEPVKGAAEVAEEDEDAEEAKDAKKKAKAEAKAAKAAQKAAEKAADESKRLTMERLEKIQESAKDSFTALKAVLTCYHAAVKSLEGNQVEDEDDLGEMSKAKRRRKMREKSLLRIDDEATFSAVIEFTLVNFIGLLRPFCGELESGASQGGAGKKNAAKRQKGAGGGAVPEFPADILDPTKFSRWPRIKVVASIFFEETYKLLTRLTDSQMIEFVLRHLSTQEALCWLWPLKGARVRFLRKCCSLWSRSSTHSIRLLAFLFVRNAAALATVAPVTGGPLFKDQPEIEVVVRAVLKAFADATNLGYSWLSVSTFRFMENCFVELLRLDEPTAYRIGYACIRQLALILRNACIATSQSGEAKGWKTENKKKKGQQKTHIQNLVGWPFIRSAHLWTRAIGSLECLKPLAYPLSMVLTGALKTKLGSIQYFPFVYHCFRCLNRASASLEAFIPVSSHLLKALNDLLPAIDKAHRKRKSSGGGGTAKAPEVEVLLKFSEGMAHEVMTLEAVGNSICFLFVEHLGLLARSPAFPELVAPVLYHLKKNSKHCRSEPIRRQLKQTVERLEDSMRDIRARREALTEVPAWSKFFVFPADSAIAKARADAIARKEKDERSRVEAELKAGDAEKDKKKGRKAGEDAEEEDGKPKKVSRRQRKLEKQKRKEEEGEEPAEATPKAKPRAPEVGEPGKDLVEEMGFSSGEEGA